MKKLLSLPPNLVKYFHEITGCQTNEYYCTHDPVNHKLGSGGGTSWLLDSCYVADNSSSVADADSKEKPSFASWLSSEKRILMHAGGQSRRLPAYAPSGKVLTPVPVFRWARGQRISQNLLTLQMALYEKMMAKTPANIHTMIVNGDVYIRTTEPLQDVPDADVVCYGLWLSEDIAKDHGVFVSKRETPNILDRMVQKPTLQELGEIRKDHYFLTDIGVWFLSDKAVEVLKKKSTVQNNGTCSYCEYDLYSEFGCSLGENPTIADDDLKDLKVMVLPLPGGEFYHYGTSPEIISSTLALQNLVNDQRAIINRKVKVQPSIFTQNSICKIKFTSENENIWVENSYIGQRWQFQSKHIVTGVPENDWDITLHEGDCIDIVPIGDNRYCARVYGFYEKFAGQAQQEKRFPVTENLDELGRFINLQLNAMHNSEVCRFNDSNTELLSAEEISNIANLKRLDGQRRTFMRHDLSAIASHYERSVFYQLDLKDAAHKFADGNIPMPEPIKESSSLMTKIRDCMFRSELMSLRGETDGGLADKAFSLLGKGLTETVLADRQTPRMSVYPDQIVWGRCPVRIDIAGGWTDTPPYCLTEGGNVINFAIELNGQPPLHCYVKTCKEPHIVLRSIDLGAVEIVKTYDELANFNKVGSPFSIPKAALVLAGFHPEFTNEKHLSLEEQLKSFGCGIELSMLAAIPAGSGLGTSSVLASTVLAAVSDFCGLAWDKNEVGKRTLVLEQMLTTGGGWQDQFGGLLQGVKLLQTKSGFDQNPVARWLPNELWTQPEYRDCHLLYYTGITRTAKKLLAQIVRKMFLNDYDELQLLAEMKQHTMDMYEAIQRCSFKDMGMLVRKTWQQNQLIDAGTNPDEVMRITQLIDDYCYGYKLGGAGGGGYLYMVAKDNDAAARIKTILAENRKNANERFVKMSLSNTGLQVSRS